MLVRSGLSCSSWAVLYVPLVLQQAARVVHMVVARFTRAETCRALCCLYSAPAGHHFHGIYVADPGKPRLKRWAWTLIMREASKSD